MFSIFVPDPIEQMWMEREAIIRSLVAMSKGICLPNGNGRALRIVTSLQDSVCYEVLDATKPEAEIRTPLSREEAEQWLIKKGIVPPLKA